MIRSFAILVGALALGSSLPALAQDESDPRLVEARQIFDRGEREFAEGAFAEAAQSYQEAWTIMHDQISPPHPRAHLVRYNWALALERGGAHGQAADIYQRYLEEGGNTEENAAEVQRRITALRSMSGGSGTGGGGISPVGPIVIGIGGAAAIVGAILGGLALAEGDSLRSDCPSLMNCGTELEDRYASMQLMAGAADGLIFGGIAVAAIGLVLTFVLTEGGGSEQAQLEVQVAGNGVRLAGTF